MNLAIAAAAEMAKTAIIFGSDGCVSSTNIHIYVYKRTHTQSQTEIATLSNVIFSDYAT